MEEDFVNLNITLFSKMVLSRSRTRFSRTNLSFVLSEQWILFHFITVKFFLPKKSVKVVNKLRVTRKNELFALHFIESFGDNKKNNSNPKGMINKPYVTV